MSEQRTENPRAEAEPMTTTSEGQADGLGRTGGLIPPTGADSRTSNSLVAELRHTADDCPDGPIGDMAGRAADEIERLQARCQALVDELNANDAIIYRLQRELERLQIGSRGNVWVEVRALRAALAQIRDLRSSSFRTYKQDADDMRAIAAQALGPADETAAVLDPRCADGCYLHRKRVNRGLEERPPEETSATHPGFCEAGRHTFLPGGGYCIRCGIKIGE